MSEVPGTIARHAIVSDECRRNRTDAGAMSEAVARLMEEYASCADVWQIGRGAKFHFVLTVERPQREPVQNSVQAPEGQPGVIGY